ncbi:MAG: hypothetical protein MUD08_06180 [Cytophagales bacterium]|jgi:hypothetical protein|nr:hypothetical protein [Cytophagales bacterium]
MFSFLKKNTAPKQHPFYGQRVTVTSVQIKTVRNNHHNEQIDTAAIDYVTMYHLGDNNGYENCWVNLKSFTQAHVSVCTLADGFAKLESLLFALPGFDKNKFLEIKHHQAEYPETVLWKKASQADFEIEAAPTGNSGLDALQKGLLIENSNRWIEWRDFVYLETLGFVKKRKQGFPNPLFQSFQYHVQKPTVLGGLKVQEMVIETDVFEQGKAKLHLPFECIKTEFRLGFGPKKDVLKIKQHLDAYLGHAAEAAETYDEHSLDFVWQKEKVAVRLYCFYREQIKSLDDVAYLTLNHTPAVDAFYQTDYWKNFVLTEKINFQTFGFPTGLNSNYRSVDNAIYTPAPLAARLTDENPTIVWRDETSGIIGIGDRTHSLLFEVSAIKSMSLEIQNFRGSEGRNGWMVYFRDNTSFRVGGVSDTQACIRSFEQINRITGLSIEESHYDEHY